MSVGIYINELVIFSINLIFWVELIDTYNLILIMIVIVRTRLQSASNSHALQLDKLKLK